MDFPPFVMVYHKRLENPIHAEPKHIILDKRQRKVEYCPAYVLTQAGIHVYIDALHSTAHNNTIIIDSQTLITGSFNFTKAAEEKNAENLLILKGNKPLVDRYIRNFEEHKGHSEEYLGK